MSDSLRPHGAKDWSTLITVGVLAVGVITSWVVLREAVTNLQQAQVHQLDKDREQDARLRAIETSRTLESQISDLKNEVSALKATVNGLRDDVRDRRRQ